MKNLLVRAALASLLALIGCEGPPCPEKPTEITLKDVWLCTFEDRKDGRVGIDQPCTQKWGDCCYGLSCQEGTCKVDESRGRLGATCYSQGDCNTPEVVCNGDNNKCHEPSDNFDWCVE